MLRAGIRQRISAACDYLSAVRFAALLVWRASARLTLGSAALALVIGVLPVADIVIVSMLLQALVNAGHLAPETRTGAVPHFVLLLAALVAISLLTQISERLEQFTMQLQATRITNRVQLLIAEKAASADLASFEDRVFHNEMRTVANEARYLPSQVATEFISSITTLAALLSMSAILVTWHVWAVAALLLASAPTLWVSAHFGSVKDSLVADRAEAERTQHYLYNLLVTDQAAKEIRLFGLRDLLVGRFSGLLGQHYREDRRLLLRQMAYSMPAGLVLAMTQITLIAFAAVDALHGTIAVGKFTQYMLTIMQLGGQLPLLAFSAGLLHQSNLFAARLSGFLARGPRVEAPRGRSPAQLPGGRPHIVFDHVSFAYPGTDREILTDVHFEVRPGQAVALVGGNGSGKSTIVKLLAGLYEPTKGSVSFNGVDIRGLDRATLRSNLSVIFQDFIIYHFSARENVGFGQVSYLLDGERIAAAARQSGLDSVIARLPDGFDTVLGRFWNKGHELSGGQRQLVALARALLRQAPALVLDEPSSALDARAEAEFFAGLLDGGCVKTSHCVIFVSHRLSAARLVDHILVLHEGHIAEQGTHEQLMKSSGIYADMFKLQSRAYEDFRAPAAPATAESRPR